MLGIEVNIQFSYLDFNYHLVSLIYNACFACIQDGQIGCCFMVGCKIIVKYVTSTESVNIIKSNHNNSWYLGYL
jgi:hypothetical protein